MDINIRKSKENILLTLSAIHKSVYSLKKDQETFAVKMDESLYASKEMIYHDGDLRIVVNVKDAGSLIKVSFIKNDKESMSLQHCFPRFFKLFCPVYRKYKSIVKELDKRKNIELMMQMSVKAEKANSVFEELFYSSFQGYVDDILLKNKNK
jgi:hypothetical protein